MSGLEENIEDGKKTVTSVFYDYKRGKLKFRYKLIIYGGTCIGIYYVNEFLLPSINLLDNILERITSSSTIMGIINKLRDD